ncbi:MAG: DUF2065 domain-containing protein [Paracoccaceae bacterium]
MTWVLLGLGSCARIEGWRLRWPFSSGTGAGAARIPWPDRRRLVGSVAVALGTALIWLAQNLLA